MMSSQSSFAAFVEDEYEVAVAVALGLLRDGDAAVDVAQEAMLRTYREWHRIQDFDRPGAWTRRVVLNLCTDQLRARSRSVRLLRRLGGGASSTSMDNVRLPDPELWDAVADLPDRQRSALVLHYLAGMTLTEVADQLGCPVGTVKSDLSRARVRLRNRLEEEHR